MRQLCGACGNMGHGAERCPKLRREERAAERSRRRAEAAERAASWRERQARGVMCYLCGEFGHKESACAGRIRALCLECGRPGHSRLACPALQQTSVLQRPLPRRDVDGDASSEASFCTVSTAATTSADLMLTREGREVRRLEKKLREISKLADRAAAGEQLDALQEEKVKRKQDVEVELDSVRGVSGARAREAARKAGA